MERLRGASLPVVAILSCLALPLCAQNTGAPLAAPATKSAESPSAVPSVAPGAQPAAAARPAAPHIAANAPHMSKQTRYAIIRDFETQLVYARSAFPMGTKGLVLKDGTVTPSGPELQQLMALWGPAVRPGDPAHISYVRIKDDYIHFDINGGAIRRKKWYQHIEITGADGADVPLSSNETEDNPHGSYLDVYFDKYVPEMTAQQLRDLLFPVLDFTARNKEEAYLDTLPPKAKAAIQAHHVLVGMDSEMVVHAMGKPPKKVREKDGEVEYEEWIYGQPPQDVDFVRFVGDEVVRVETMKVDGEKIVRTEKELILQKPDKETEAKQQERPANAPSLRRPGEDPETVPKPENGASPVPVSTPPSIPQPSDPGPGQQVASRSR